MTSEPFETDAAQAHAPEDEQPPAAPEPPAEPAPEGAEAAQVEHDLDELVAKAAQADEYLDLARRTQADFENFRKRMARESAGAEQRGVVRLAKELLPALDNLGRALAAAGEADGALADGVRLVEAELEAALARTGIESFTPAGEAFDPELHEAVAQTPVEGAATGTIVEVYERGYRVDGQLIRPARVVVAA